MNQKRIERRSLIVSSIVNFVMAVAGIVVFALTGLQALFLDGFFSFIAFLSNIMAITFSIVSKKKNKAYPTGMYFLEPLYGLVKAILIFVLLTSSMTEVSFTAYNYFEHGIGEAINITPILPYTIVMVIMCFGLSYYNKRQNKKINNSSTMLTAESKSNFVDGVISGGVGILILLLFFVNINGKLGFLHYTGDFFITLVLVLFSLKEPIKLFGMSIRELSGATAKDKEINKIVREIIKKELGEENLDNKFEIYKVGMHIKVVILLEDNIDQLVLARLQGDVLENIKQSFENVSIEYVLRKF